MILSRRGEAVDRECRVRFRRALTPERAEQRIEGLTSKNQIRLHGVFRDEDVHRLCDQLNIEFRVHPVINAERVSLSDAIEGFVASQ